MVGRTESLRQAGGRSQIKDAPMLAGGSHASVFSKRMVIL